MNFLALKKVRIYALAINLLLLLIVILSGLFLKPYFFDSVEVERIVNNFQGQPNNPNGMAPISLNIDVGRVESAVIQFTVRINSDYYDNIFQTADQGGIRIEMQKPGKALLVLNNRVVALSDDFKIGRWYNFRIDYIPHKLIVVEIDGKKVFEESDGTNGVGEYSFNNLMVGTGFAHLRPLNGDLKYFHIKISHTPLKIWFLVISWSAVFLFSVLFLILAWPSKHVKNSLRIIEIVSLSSLIVPIAGYQLLYVNGFFPITEGWFIEYAQLMLKGSVPYRDYSLLLPPLYTATLAMFQLIFGVGFFQIHLLGVCITVGIAISLYILLRGIFSAPASAIGALISTIYYQSGPAYIGYDFTQFLTLFFLLGAVFLARYFRLVVATPQGSFHTRKFAFFSGLMFSLAILIKHSNGGVTTIFVICGVFILAVLIRPFFARAMEVLSMALGGLIPIISLLVWLIFYDLLSPFFQNVFSDAMSAKGGAAAIINHSTGYLKGGELFISFLEPFKLLVLVFISIVSVIGLLVLIGRIWKISFPNPLKLSSGENYCEILILFSSVILFLAFAIVGGLTSLPWLDGLGSQIRGMCILMATCLYLIGAATSVFTFAIQKSPTTAYIFSVFIFCIGIMFGNGTSSGLSEISSFIGIGLVISTMITISMPLILPSVIPMVLSIALCINLFNAKFDVPYSWWGVQTPPIGRQQCAQAQGLLAGMCLSKEDYSNILEISENIRDWSDSNDAIYVYPHMPIFYILTDRMPFNGAVVSWFDFMSDRQAKDLAKNLKDKTPAVIVVGTLPKYVMEEHEKRFRNNTLSRQREIIFAVDEMVTSGKLRLLGASKIINRIPVEVYVRVVGQH